MISKTFLVNRKVGRKQSQNSSNWILVDRNPSVYRNSKHGYTKNRMAKT